MAAVASCPSTFHFSGGPLSPTRLSSAPHHHVHGDAVTSSSHIRDLGEGPSSRPTSAASISSSPTSVLEPPSTLKVKFLHGKSSAGAGFAVGEKKGKLWEEALKNPLKFVVGEKEMGDTGDVSYEPVNKPLQAGQGRGVLIKAMGPPIEGEDEEAEQWDVQKVEAKAETPLVAKKLKTAPVFGGKRPLASPPIPPISTHWTRQHRIGPGFHNNGNTCFLNSTLQVLVHTPPLVAGLLERKEHTSQDCALWQERKYCALCAVHQLVAACFNPNRGYVMDPVSIHLRRIAPTMREGRQEDAHEFLRFLVDAMQNGALGGKGDKAKQSEKESTMIHRMFGGRLRSRVTCEQCQTHSDTFDAFLDLSLDIREAATVQQAIKGFRKVDQLVGQNKYKCEQCKGFQNAKKAFTIDAAPPILTIHLKRFSATGKKNNKSLDYNEFLDLRPAMSSNSSQRYKLYAVVNHAGGSNLSGHYYSYIKGPDGKWFEMNDQSVRSIVPNKALGAKNAYVLFYAKEMARLDETIEWLGGGLVRGQNGKKRVREDDSEEDDSGQPVAKSPNDYLGTPNVSVNGNAKKAGPFIGPIRSATPEPPVVTTASASSLTLSISLIDSKTVALEDQIADFTEDNLKPKSPKDRASLAASATIGTPFANALLLGSPAVPPVTPKSKPIDEMTLRSQLPMSFGKNGAVGRLHTRKNPKVIKE